MNRSQKRLAVLLLILCTLSWGGVSAVAKSDFDILGVHRNDTKVEIKAVYKRLVKKYHPDNQSTGDVEKFREIQEAWERIEADGPIMNHDAFVHVPQKQGPPRRTGPELDREFRTELNRLVTGLKNQSPNNSIQVFFSVFFDEYGKVLTVDRMAQMLINDSYVSRDISQAYAETRKQLVSELSFVKSRYGHDILHFERYALSASIAAAVTQNLVSITNAIEPLKGPVSKDTRLNGYDLEAHSKEWQSVATEMLNAMTKSCYIARFKCVHDLVFMVQERAPRILQALDEQGSMILLGYIDEVVQNNHKDWLMSYQHRQLMRLRHQIIRRHKGAVASLKDCATLLVKDRKYYADRQGRQ